MKKHLFILPLVALICACSCQPTGNNNEQTELLWDTVSLCIENPVVPGESLCYQIEINLDTLEGESELARQFAVVIRDSVIGVSGQTSIEEAVTAFADSVQTEWTAELAERYDPDSEYRDIFQYYYTINGKPVEETAEGILSYEVQTSCYLGGAHGSHVVQYYNFDKESGKLLTIGDIIPAEKEMLVLMAMMDKLCKDWDAKDQADLQEKTGITMLGDLYLTNNFLLKGDSILFLFNQYEIAPYSSGLISVTLPRP